MSYMNITKTIQGYGSEYSMKKYMLTVFLTLAAIVLTSKIFYLQGGKIILLAIISVAATPGIILSQFRFVANNDRFEALSNYMEMMILSIKRQPKILFALEQTLEYVNSNKDMRSAVEEGIYIIKNDTESENVYAKAFKVIEDRFPCSRLHTLHGFLLTVETESSIDYHDSLDSLYFDIRSWVTRTYQYQADLTALKRKIVIIITLSIGIAGYFARLLHKAEVSMPANNDSLITGSSAFQVTTAIYLIAFIILYSFLQSKITGQWLIDDVSEKKDRRIIKYLSYVDGFDMKKEMLKAIMVAVICGVPAMGGMIIGSNVVTVFGLIMMVFVLAKPRMDYRRRKKAVERALIRQFPMWLREISIKLNNNVVIRAVEESIDSSATVLQGFLRNFVKRIEEDPVSIKPYNDFIGKYNASELSTAFKTLYVVQTLSKEDSKKYVNDLIERNQILIENAEKLRNEDSLSGITFISILPMLLMSFKLIIDMVLLLVSFLNLADGVVG
ncbi:MAG: hypothetical protein PUB87_04800 [Eubacteriaceae bacterium]|nr:hypothetical protein [Eubacteriaceae bacterium]